MCFVYVSKYVVCSVRAEGIPSIVCILHKFKQRLKQTTFVLLL